MGREVVGHFQPGDVVVVLDDEVGDVGRTVLAVEYLLAAEELGFPADIEQAPDVVVAVACAHPELAGGDVLAAGVIGFLRHAQFACAMLEQVAEDGDAGCGGAADGGGQDLERGHDALTSWMRSTITRPALMPSAAQPSAPTAL